MWHCDQSKLCTKQGGGIGANRTLLKYKVWSAGRPFWRKYTKVWNLELSSIHRPSQYRPLHVIHPPTKDYLIYHYHRFKPHSSLSEFVVYGGIELDNMSVASYLCQLRLKGGRRSYMDVTLIEQHDDVPSARFGHKMTKIDEQSVLMHGGLSLDLRSSDHFVQDTFRQVLSDQHFNILDVASKIWSKLRVKAHCARAFHSAGFLTRILYPSLVGYGHVGLLGLENA